MYKMYDIKCFKCGNHIDICHDDGAGYEEDTTHEQNCNGCNETVYFTTSIMYHYEETDKDGNALDDED